jgi:hypothetical protein
MDDLIYVLALIAWVIFAFYRKSQKKSGAARETQQQQKPRGEAFPLPTLEEILLGKEEYHQPEPEPVTAPVTTDGMSPVLKETSFEREYNLRGITSIEEMDKSFTVAEKVIPDAEEKEENSYRKQMREYLADFDGRQAVIYSEILNRPYV